MLTVSDTIVGMAIHTLQLAAAPFSAIVSGKKVIESRLYDKKRQAIQIGDTIVFTNRESPGQTISVIVTDLLRYDTFHELFSSTPSAKFGSKSVEWLDAQINMFYSPEDQQKHGVLGIEFNIA